MALTDSYMAIWPSTLALPTPQSYTPLSLDGTPRLARCRDYKLGYLNETPKSIHYLVPKTQYENHQYTIYLYLYLYNTMSIPIPRWRLQWCPHPFFVTTLHRSLSFSKTVSSARNSKSPPRPVTPPLPHLITTAPSPTMSRIHSPLRKRSLPNTRHHHSSIPLRILSSSSRSYPIRVNHVPSP